MRGHLDARRPRTGGRNDCPVARALCSNGVAGRLGLACSTPFAHSRQGSWGAGQADARLPSSFGSGSGRQALRYHSIHSFHLPAAMSRRGRGFVQPPHSVSVRSSRCAVGVTGRLACPCRATNRDRRPLLTGDGCRAGWCPFNFSSRIWFRWVVVSCRRRRFNTMSVESGSDQV